MITLYGSCRCFLGGSPERCNLFGLLGYFQRCLQCGSENSLISYGIFLWKYLCALSVCRLNPLVGFAVCTRYINYTHFAECAEHFELAVVVPALAQLCRPLYYFFPFGRWRARGRFVGKRHSRLTLKPTSSPVLTLPL